MQNHVFHSKLATCFIHHVNIKPNRDCNLKKLNSKFPMTILLAVFLTSIYSGSAIQLQEDLGDVVFVNVLYRHGDRTPIDPYPTDPYRNRSFWPVGWGQLTDNGMRGHYDLGKWLRKRYGNLLPEVYDSADIFVQSTDVDRTLMSAYCNLAGLYQPKASINWNPKIDWRPIPVHTTAESSDEVLHDKLHHLAADDSLISIPATLPVKKVLAQGKKCPRFNAERKALLKTKFFRKVLEENMYLMETMSNATGLLIRDFKNIEYVYNTLFIEHLYNLDLPPWTATVFPEPMKSLADFSFSIDCYTPKLARLKVGPLLLQMVNHLKFKAKGGLDPDRKMWMYSAHDTTVANFLQGLKIFNGISPPYHSTVMMELRKKDQEYFVTIFYYNSSDVPPHLLTMPGCTALCPIDKFLTIVQPILPDNWERECQLSLMEAFYESTGAGIISYVAAASLILIILVLAFRIFRRTSEPHDNIVYTSLSAAEAT